MWWNSNQNCFNKENHLQTKRCRWISLQTRQTLLFKGIHLDREMITNFQRLKMCSSIREKPRRMSHQRNMANIRHPPNPNTNPDHHTIIHSTKSLKHTITSRWGQIGRKIICFCRERFTVMMMINMRNLQMSNYRSIRFRFREIKNFSPYPIQAKKFPIFPKQKQWNQ